MPAFGEVTMQTYQQPSTLLGSPSIWAKSPGTRAADDAIGYNVLADFKTGLLPLIFSSTTGAAIAYDTNYDSVVKITNGTLAAGTNGVGLTTRPLGQIIVAGNNSYEFEAIVALQQISTQGCFVGLCSFYGASTANSIISAVTSTASTNTLVAASLFGFWMHGDSPNTFDAVYQSTSLGVSTVLANALNASVFTASSTQPQLSGTQTGQGVLPPTTPYPLTASTFVKLGLTYTNSGPTPGTVKWFVNGVQVASLAAQGNIDTAPSYAPVVAFASSTSTQTFALDVGYFRANYHWNQ